MIFTKNGVRYRVGGSARTAFTNGTFMYRDSQPPACSFGLVTIWIPFVLWGPL